MMKSVESLAFAIWLKNSRTDAGITQQQLADLLQLSRVSIANYETGKQTPGFFTFLTIADKLNANPKSFLDLHKDITEMKYSEILLLLGEKK